MRNPGEMDRERGANGDIQVIARLGDVLRQFGPDRSTLRLAPLAEELGMQRPTLHRYLNSMVSAGLLERTADANYSLGPLLVQLGTTALSGLHVIEAALPSMRQLADDARQTVVLGVWGGSSVVVARVVEVPDTLVRVVVRPASVLPIDSAQTQVFLAFSPDPQLVRGSLALLDQEARENVTRQVLEVRTTGISVWSRISAGIRAVAVPVFSAGDRVVASLAVVGTTEAIPDDRRSGLARSLAHTGASLSRQLGGPETYPASAFLLGGEPPTPEAPLPDLSGLAAVTAATPR